MHQSFHSKSVFQPGLAMSAQRGLVRSRGVLEAASGLLRPPACLSMACCGRRWLGRPASGGGRSGGEAEKPQDQPQVCAAAQVGAARTGLRSASSGMDYTRPPVCGHFWTHSAQHWKFC
jgi:hypothetical protein